VVYQMHSHGVPQAGRSVCQQAEWDELQQAKPGSHVLIQDNIPNEVEAEKLARGSAGDSYRNRGSKTKSPTPATI
jgi:hypothetical protein